MSSSPAGRFATAAACRVALLGALTAWAGAAAAAPRDVAVAPRLQEPAVGAEREAAPRRAAPAPGGLDTVAVLVDHAKVIRLPERAQTVIIGNPAIADVAVQKSGVLVVTGKAYGVTNMIALDGAGAMLAESLISVQAPSESLVTVQRGFDRESYSCTPNCQPSILLGDSQKYFGEVTGQSSARNGIAGSR